MRDLARTREKGGLLLDRAVSGNIVGVVGSWKYGFAMSHYMIDTATPIGDYRTISVLLLF